MGSLEQHYGPKVTSRMDLRELRKLQERGRPLYVRHVREAMKDADIVVDGLKMIGSSDVEGMVEERVRGAAYADQPGGDDLAREVRKRIDVGDIEKQWLKDHGDMYEAGRATGESSLLTTTQLVGQAANDAVKDLFLFGYGLKTIQGTEFGKLQEVVDSHPVVHELRAKYGLEFDASRATGALYQSLAKELGSTLRSATKHPELLPDGGSIKERIGKAVDEAAERVVDEFIWERSEALERLHDLHAEGRVQADGGQSQPSVGDGKLADVVLHHRIPPGMLGELCRLRNAMPGDLGDLVSTSTSMERKVEAVAEFGNVLGELYEGISEEDTSRYMPDPDAKLDFIHDCGRFLLEGKLSTDAESAIREAVRPGASNGDVAELLHGIANMRGGMYEPGSRGDRWAAATVPLERMSMATVGLLGPDAPPLMGTYTSADSRLLTAMRNCGLMIPPPGDPRAEQSGTGTFSRLAMEAAEREMLEDVAKYSLDNPDKAASRESKEYPGFLREAVVDFNRSNYIVDGMAVEYGDVGAVVRNIREFCNDGNGNPDRGLLNVVGQLVSQRANSMALLRFAGGHDESTDRTKLLTTAPILGLPAFEGTGNTYEVGRKGDGDVVVHIRNAGQGQVLIFDGTEQQYLDADRSTIGLDIYVEIDAMSYLPRVTDMTYEYHFVPSDQEP